MKRPLVALASAPPSESLVPWGRARAELVRVVFRLALTLCVALALACTKAKPKAATTERIVSLSPSTTEAVFAIGAGSKLVGRSRYCNFPPDVMKLPQVGGYVDPSFEAILALMPDLVVGARGPAGSALSERLEARGIATYFPETESLASIDAMILGLGERTNRAEAGAAAAAVLRGRIASVERSVAGLPRTRVLLVFGLSPLSVAGPSSFADEMIRRAGGTNVVTEGGLYPTIGAEHVLKLDPDVVINAAMMEERASERLRKDAPGWDRVRAVQEGHVTSITDEAVLRPGPRIADGIAMLARALHPGARIELDR
jgi:iron complex transport system substrate-binding protein